MKRAWKVLAIGVVVLGLAGSTAFAQGARGWHPGAGGGVAGFGPVLRTLNLTDAQKGQIRQIMANHRSQFQTLRQQLRDAQKQLGDKLYDPSSTADQLAPLTQQVNQLRNQLGELGVQVALEIRSVLSADQIAKAAQTRQRLSELRGEMRALMSPSQ